MSKSKDIFIITKLTPYLNVCNRHKKNLDFLICSSGVGFCWFCISSRLQDTIHWPFFLSPPLYPGLGREKRADIST